MDDKQLRGNKSKMRGDIGEKEVILSLSKFGWPTQKLIQDEGEDIIVEVQDNFTSSGLKFQIQVKTPEKFKKGKDGSFLYDIEVSHLKRWRDMIPPVVICLWEIDKMRGYWVTVADVVNKLEKGKDNWEQQDHIRISFPASNTTDRTGLRKLRRGLADLVLPYVRQNKQIKCELEFSIPNTPDGRSFREEISRFYKQGEKLKVDTKYLENVRFPDWFEKLYGPDINESTKKSLGSFTVGPRSSKDQFELILCAISTSNKRIAQQNIMVRAIAVGDEQVRYSNAEKPNPFWFEMVARRNGHYEVNISLAKSVSSAKEMQEVFPLFEALSQGGKLRVQLLTKSDVGNEWVKVEIPMNPQPQFCPSDQFRHLINDMAEIEKATGVSFKLEDSGITQQQSIIISDLIGIIRTGRRQIDAPSVSFTMGDFVPSSKTELFSLGEQELPYQRPETPDNWLQDMLNAPPDQSQHIDVTFDAEMQILGTVIPLGKVAMTVDGTLSKECREDLQKRIVEGTSAKRTLLEFTDAHIAEEFKDWLPE